MQLELILSPALYDSRQLSQHHTTVAVDVLRATSSVCAAFQAGADSVLPLDSLEPLPSLFEQGYTIAAERDGKKVPNAQCGNSPTEYLTMNLKGKRLAYSTTNGTVSILRARQSDRLYVGAFANLTALKERLLADRTERLVILCSGWKGDPCIEDTLFGGALAEALGNDTGVTLVNDAAMMAQDLWLSVRGDLFAYCRKASHVHRLQRLNYDNDIRWCLQVDTCTVVPRYDIDLQMLVL